MYKYILSRIIINRYVYTYYVEITPLKYAILMQYPILYIPMKFHHKQTKNISWEGTELTTKSYRSPATLPQKVSLDP